MPWLSELQSGEIAKNMTIKKDLVLRIFSFLKIVSLFPVHVKPKDAFPEK